MKNLNRSTPLKSKQNKTQPPKTPRTQNQKNKKPNILSETQGNVMHNARLDLISE